MLKQLIPFLLPLAVNWQTLTDLWFHKNTIKQEIIQEFIDRGEELDSDKWVWLSTYLIDTFPVLVNSIHNEHSREVIYMLLNWLNIYELTILIDENEEIRTKTTYNYEESIDKVDKLWPVIDSLPYKRKRL